ncbi:hypothetical protein JTB14_036658 [Gonioctena quinquepunctata]|nr:hypothetical protein JTB14_036658 [Gonioctena quinquepunctata]
MAALGVILENACTTLRHNVNPDVTPRNPSSRKRSSILHSTKSPGDGGEKVVWRGGKFDTKFRHHSKFKSYAGAARSDRVVTASGRVLRTENKESIIISPCIGNPDIKDCNDTKRILLTKFTPSVLGLKPDRILRHGKMSIRIEAPEIVKDNINIEALRSAGLRVEISGKMKPKIAIFGVPNRMTIEEVKKEIIESLPDTIKEDELELKFKFGPRDRSFDHWESCC